jgi:hypothetical protein
MAKHRTTFFVSRLLDAVDKEIAFSVLFLSAVVATRQSPPNDSDMRLERPDPGTPSP